jgi:ribonuclease P protein subunit RPR2
MSKVKPPKSKGIPSKHLHARTTFLYQAATYLSLQTSTSGTAPVPAGRKCEHVAAAYNPCFPDHSPVALQLASHLQQVSRKAQLRLAVDIKRTMCKRCNTILVHGRTASQMLENTSKGGKKPWADVLVLECKMCGGKKRFPVGATKQNKKNIRRSISKDTVSTTGLEDTCQTDSMAQTSTELDADMG